MARGLPVAGLLVFVQLTAAVVSVSHVCFLAATNKGSYPRRPWWISLAPHLLWVSTTVPRHTLERWSKCPPFAPSWDRSSPRFSSNHRQDFPPGANIDTFKAELDHWQLLLQGLNPDDRPVTVSDSLKLASQSLCPTIARLLQLLATWPVTTCSCERSISTLRRPKTYLRSTMQQERLLSLAILHVHG